MENHTQHQSFTIKQLSNKELLSHTKLLVQKERNIHIKVLRHLAEIDSRKLFFRQGFFSLFDYAVRELGYSEGAAYRRIKAMKLCRELPETANRLQSGRLSLSAASQLQVFFEKQDKKVSQNEEFKENLESQKFLSQEEKESLVERAEGCSTRATEKLLSEADPSLSPLTKREKVRFLGKGKVEIKVIIDEKCHKELETLKNLLSHRNPKLSYGELISILSKEALKKHDPRRKNTRPKKEEKIQENPSVKKQEFKNRSVELAATFAPKPRHTIKKISRFIPSYLRKYVWERDGSQCTYVHHETKRRCASRHLLQIDHIQPFALGGRSEKENLRLLCAGHNQYRR